MPICCVVDGDPLQDLALLEDQGKHLSVIMKAGKFHKRRLRLDVVPALVGSRRCRAVSCTGATAQLSRSQAAS